MEVRRTLSLVSRLRLSAGNSMGEGTRYTLTIGLCIPTQFLQNPYDESQFIYIGSSRDQMALPFAKDVH